MRGASRGDRKDARESHNKFFQFVALAVWLFGIHLNVLICLLCLLCLVFLPIGWAITILVLWLSQILLPVFAETPFTDCVARFIAKHAPAYFPIEAHAEDIDALDPNRAHVLALEPHSVLPISLIATTKHYGFLPFVKSKALATTAVFWTPVLRHVWSWLGLVPASKKICREKLSDGYSCIVVPGGVQECLYLRHGHETIFLKKRFGFIRVAMEAGAPLVPCFCFGQSEVYHYWKPCGKWYADLSRAIGFTPLIFWGMYGSPLPYPKRMYLVVGKPIEVQKNSSPSHEEVTEIQTKFIAAMEKLFEKHKVAAGYKDATLTVH
ncbi:hypothetical protein R1flu_005919 [Riccia fluitans]|uniref:Acyltransferase n=1 Tax=Riccia fluitans TaxID=41844 RepID=A0ABD1YUS7_9MARC